MRLVFVYAMMAGIIGWMPLSSSLLVPMEVVMIYHIAYRNNVPILGEGLALGVTLWGVANFLKFFVGEIFLNFVPTVGQLSKSVIAFGFVIVLGAIVDQYFKQKAEAAITLKQHR